MNRFVALLRGINVSGQKLIKMEDLKNHFEDIGFLKVRTYIQSGNVVFDSKESNARNISEGIEKKLKDIYGFEVKIIVKTKNELESIINNNPFIKNKDIDTKKMYVTLLSELPTDNAKNNLIQFNNNIDHFVVIDDVIYTLYAISYGTSNFSNNFIEKRLGVFATTRNWATMTKLAGMMNT